MSMLDITYDEYVIISRKCQLHYLLIWIRINSFIDFFFTIFNLINHLYQKSIVFDTIRRTGIINNLLKSYGLYIS